MVDPRIERDEVNLGITVKALLRGVNVSILSCAYYSAYCLKKKKEMSNNLGCQIGMNYLTK